MEISLNKEKRSRKRRYYEIFVKELLEGVLPRSFLARRRVWGKAFKEKEKTNLYVIFLNLILIFQISSNGFNVL